MSADIQGEPRVLTDAEALLAELEGSRMGRESFGRVCDALEALHMHPFHGSAGVVDFSERIGAAMESLCDVLSVGCDDEVDPNTVQIDFVDSGEEEYVEVSFRSELAVGVLEEAAQRLKVDNVGAFSAHSGDGSFVGFPLNQCRRFYLGV
jgi:hypothetical protein